MKKVICVMTAVSAMVTAILGTPRVGAANAPVMTVLQVTKQCAAKPGAGAQYGVRGWLTEGRPGRVRPELSRVGMLWQNQTAATNLGMTGASIVLLVRPETHLHMRTYLRTVEAVGELMCTGSKAQFVVSGFLGGNGGKRVG